MAVNNKKIQQLHNHQTCKSQALKSAETVCEKKGLRLTSIRRRILELICASHKAVGAYELLDLFREEDPKAKPVTIYRALDFLMDAGLVHKIESLNAFIGCLQAETKHQAIIMICNDCKNAYEQGAPAIYKSIYAISEKTQFSPTSLTIELHGLCCSCA